MNDLPKGWVERPLAEFCEVVRGGSPRPIKSYITNDPSGINWIKIGDAPVGGKFISETEERIIPEGVSRSRFVREGDFILSNSMSFGRPYIMKTTGCVHDGWLVLSPDYSVVDQDYLYLVLGSPVVFRQLDDMAAGVTVRNLNIGLVKKTKIPLPPLAEQRRIVEKLDALSTQSRAAATALTRIETLITRYKAAVLAAAFRDPELWEGETTLGNLLLGIKAGKNLRCIERPPAKNEIGVVKVSAVTYGAFDPTQSKTLPTEFKPDPETLIREGDFLFSRANTIELVGACAIVEAAPHNLYLSDKILRLDMPDEYKVWIDVFLKSPIGRGALEEASSGNQHSMRNIGQAKLQQILVPMSDPERRREIIARITESFAQIETLTRAVAGARARLKSLGRAVLAKAFRGQLVPQDPNDEPASELLKRIKENAG